MKNNKTSAHKPQTLPSKSFFDMKYLLSFLFMVVSIVATAQTIAVQGILRDPKGRTVDDGFYKVIFSLYEDEAAGSALWTETHTSLRTNNGLFVAKLGSFHDLDVAFDTTYYLGIAIEGREEISPRMALSLAPYAMAVYGKDNQFPSTGDVYIKSSLNVEEGNIKLPEGNIYLEKGDVQLDTGNLNLQQGDIILNKVGAGIHFADGTVITTAFGGTAANLSNNNSVIIAADTDLDNIGSIDLNIGDSTFMRINNDGIVSFAKDLVIDSGQIMVKSGVDLPIGHLNADSTFSEVMNMKANGSVVFNGTVKASGTAVADDDLVNLATLNEYLLPHFPDTITTKLDVVVGQTYGGGTVFEVDEEYAYIVYFTSIGYALGDNNSVWSSSTAFGAGYQNTQNMLAATSYESSSSYVQYHITRDINGYSDWYLPSTQELRRIMQNTPSVIGPDWISTSSQCAPGYVDYLLFTSPSTIAVDCDRVFSGQSYDHAFIRREPVGETIIQYNENSLLAVGALINSSVQSGYEIGQSTEGGTVFEIDDNYAYIAYHTTTGYDIASGGSWVSSPDFGAGYDNTQALFAAYAFENNSSYVEYYLTREINGYSDWYLPSLEELRRVMVNTPSVVNNEWVSSSTNCGTGLLEYLILDANSTISVDCDSDTDGSSYEHVFIRRVSAFKTSSGDATDLVTVGFLLEKIEALEAQIEVIQGPPIGTEIGGGTVFLRSGGYVYIATIEDANDGHYFYDNSITTGVSYGSYTDWYIPSTSLIRQVLDNTDLESSATQYFWSNAPCATDSYTVISADGNSICDQQYNSNTVLLVRKVLASEL